MVGRDRPNRQRHGEQVGRQAVDPPTPAQLALGAGETRQLEAEVGGRRRRDAPAENRVSSRRDEERRGAAGRPGAGIDRLIPHRGAVGGGETGDLRSSQRAGLVHGDHDVAVGARSKVDRAAADDLAAPLHPAGQFGERDHGGRPVESRTTRDDHVVGRRHHGQEILGAQARRGAPENGAGRAVELVDLRGVLRSGDAAALRGVLLGDGDDHVAVGVGRDFERDALAEILAPHDGTRRVAQSVDDRADAVAGDARAADREQAVAVDGAPGGHAPAGKNDRTRNAEAPRFVAGQVVEFDDPSAILRTDEAGGEDVTRGVEGDPGRLAGGDVLAPDRRTRERVEEHDGKQRLARACDLAGGDDPAVGFDGDGTRHPDSRERGSPGAGDARHEHQQPAQQERSPKPRSRIDPHRFPTLKNQRPTPGFYRCFAHFSRTGRGLPGAPGAGPGPLATAPPHPCCKVRSIGDYPHVADPCAS